MGIWLGLGAFALFFISDYNDWKRAWVRCSFVSPWVRCCWRRERCWQWGRELRWCGDGPGRRY